LIRWCSWISVVISAVFVAWGVIAADNLAAVAGAILDFVIADLGWVFILSSFGFLAFSVYLALSRYGKIRLGGEDERPEFRTRSSIAMMFSAGMGIGLMFYRVAEPIYHLGAPPQGLAKANTRKAAQVAMKYSHFHWAFHPWAMYAVLGLALAYFTFRKGMPNLISTVFYPLLGERVNGPVGRTIDILAIFRHPVRIGHLAGPWRPADQQRAQLSVGCAELGNGGDRDHRGLDGGVCGLCGVGGAPWDPVARQHQHGAGSNPALVPVRIGADGVYPQQSHRSARRIPGEPRVGCRCCTLAIVLILVRMS
jgi:hypothetical protein